MSIIDFVDAEPYPTNPSDVCITIYFCFIFFCALCYWTGDTYKYGLNTDTD
jgi:hypothetical protein